MDKEILKQYAPWLVIALMFFMQYNLFVTPVQLEKTHREILNEIKNEYVTKDVGDDLRAQLNTMQYKIDEIYKIISKKGGF